VVTIWSVTYTESPLIEVRRTSASATHLVHANSIQRGFAPVRMWPVSLTIIQYFNTRQGFTLQEDQGRAATRGHMGDLIGQARLLDGRG